jgi:hypothetical protein
MTYEAIRHVSEALVDRLQSTVDHPELPVSPNQIELTSPADIGPNSTVRVGVYPYRVTQDGSVGSMSRQEVDDSAHRDPPLPVTIDYLVTTYPRDDEDSVSGTIGQQQALGLVLQTINDNSVFEPEAVQGIEQNSRIALSITSQPLEQLLSLWARFDATYHPSVSVEAAPVMIQSINETEFTRVAERDVDVEDTGENE